jgi:class 3 adenylate cyclase
MALSRVLCPTLVGRDAELSTLEDALLAALRGDGGVVIVGGEAGMGKTRLVNAVAMRARRLGCVVISGGCSEAELSLPYLPFLEAIGNYLATADVTALRDRLGPAAEELAQLFPQLGRPASSTGDAAQAKMRLFESILMLLRDAANQRAALLILEDLQWADPATRELLDYATRRLRSTNVLVIATYRTDEMHRKHALLPTIQGWRRSGQVEMIDLNALSADQVAEMVCAIFEERSVTDEFRDFLRERSEGNPFVLEEMLRDALDRGDIFRTDTGWDRKTLAEIRIPPTVRDTILQRLERLTTQDVAVLSAASVMGRSFDLASLAVVANADEGVALAALEASVTAQLIEEEDRVSGRYRFRHALTREAIYEDLVVPRRRQLHSRVADVIRTRQDRTPVDLANQLFMAGRNAEAVEMCVAAADDAIRSVAFRDAGELLERAAPHIQDAVERARVLCRAADCYWNNSESARAKNLLEHAIADLEAAGLEVEAATHRLLLGRCLWELLHSDLAQEQFEKVRATLEPVGPSEGLALAYMRLGGLAGWDGDHATALAHSQRAVELAERAGADLVRAWSLNFLAGAEVGLGQVEEGFAHFEESYQASVRGNYRFQVGNAVYNALWEAIALGDADKIARWSDRISAGWTTEAAPWPIYLRALVALERGRVPESIELARSALQKSRDAGHEKMVWRSAVVLGHALAENMRVDEAAAVMPPVSSRVDVQDAIYHTTARVRFQLSVGDVPGAVEDAMTVPLSACHLATPVDSVAEVVTDAAWLRSFIDQLPAHGEVLASARLALANGRLAILEARYSEAMELLRRADREFRQGGLLLDGWHVGRALAEAQFRSGDVDGAQERLVSVVSEAEAAGAHLAARLAIDVALRLGLEVAVPAPRFDEATAPRIAPGERLVSVLFADVRGYAEMSGQRAPADIAERIASLQRWATQEVQRRHGIVDKFAGDAIMATFNISGQSVDHAVQALRAAVAIIDKAALAELPVGAAVAVGPAVVGSLAESANLSVLGEVTNLASRLQAQAAAGQVILTEEVYRRAKEWLEAQRVQIERVELALKGFESPVVGYRVTTGVGIPAPA